MSTEKKKSEKQIEQNIQKLWNNIKQSNVYVAGVPEEERQNGALEMFAEMMAENIPKMIKYIKLQIQETFLQNPGWPHPDKSDSHQ